MQKKILLMQAIMALFLVKFSMALKENIVISSLCNVEKISKLSTTKELDPMSEQVVFDVVPKNDYVHTYILSNGMTVLARQVPDAGKVSVQVWYNVGSKDEKDGERGIAHLIEHMIFKGTEKLSESDINVITHRLSGDCNAFTSYDFTGYLFNLPTHNWQYSLEILSDCMQNCTFKEDMLSSEMKAVVQELKMYRDNYVRSLVDEKIGIIFPDHPYHHPIIGYKQDLWTVSSKDLQAFYKKHYKPNNATLVVVGNVDPEQVHELAKKHFGEIEPDKNYAKEQFYLNRDLVARSVTLYRDVQQPIVIFSFVVPGSTEKKDHIISLIEIILGRGKSSCLYKKIVDELQLATSLRASADELFDHGLFFILVEPKTAQDIEIIKAEIIKELNRIMVEGVSDLELVRAVKQVKMDLYELMEDSEHQAHEIGKYFLATGDANYVFNYLNFSPAVLKKDVQDIFKNYFRPSVMHQGLILPLPEQELEHWVQLQEMSDKQDNRILSARVRTTAVEAPSYANKLVIAEPNKFTFPKAKYFTLSNGLKILYHNNTNIPKIDIIIELGARPYYDPEDKQGLYNFVTEMMTEGTKNFTGQALASAIESRGISLDVRPGSISMSLLSEDFEFGLEILHEILTNAMFNKDEIEKIRTQILANLKSFWDNPNAFSGQLIQQEIYKNHPFSKNSLGTEEFVKSMTQQDLINFYKKYISPQGTRLAIVGDLSGYDVESIMQKQFASWQTGAIEAMQFPQLIECKAREIDYSINRDQVVLCFAAPSIRRTDADYDKLMLFDQIFGSRSINSRLFRLREQSGLFYTINGSLVVGANEQPGVVLVKTIVSLDRLAEAEKAIKDTVDAVIDSVTPQELEEAKNIIINSLVDKFESNEKMAKSFLFLDRYNFSTDFFDTRASVLKKIDLQQVQAAARKVLDSNRFLTFRIGRLTKQVNSES